MARLVDGTVADATPLERAIVALARRTWAAPARLDASDLQPLRALVGDGAIDYALVVAAFHFINRIADLLHVDGEVLPESLRRFETLRRIGVRVAGLMMARWNLANREYRISYEDACARFAGARAAGDGRADRAAVIAALAPLRSRPKVVEVVQLALAERDLRSSLDRGTLAAVHAGVEAALPASIDDAEGFHTRPPDAVGAFVFVGTRYPARTTAEMIAALRRDGYDDLGILDLAIAVADANQWARLHRLLGLPPALFYVGTPTLKPRDRAAARAS